MIYTFMRRFVIFSFALFLVACQSADTPSVSVDSFEDCVAAGNSIMESYPRQCIHEGELFVEEVTIDDVVVDGDEMTEEEFNDSGRAKAIEDETDLWQVFDDPEAGITVKYPHSVSRERRDDGMWLAVSITKIDDLELEGALGFNQETARANRAALAAGEESEDVDFQWPGSRHLIEIDDSVNAQKYTVLSRFEVCDVTFEHSVYFFHNDRQIVITIGGPKEQLMEELKEYFTTDAQNCPGEVIWNHDMSEELYRPIERRHGPVAMEWMDTFLAIVDTIELSESQGAPIQLPLLQGEWTSTDDPDATIVFEDGMMTDYYFSDEVTSTKFVLERKPKGIEQHESDVYIVTDDSEIFAIVDLSEDTLELLHLPRGNTLKFQR